MMAAPTKVSPSGKTCQNNQLKPTALSVFKWFETDELISQRRDWLIGFKV